MSYLKKYAWYGSAVVASALLMVAILVTGTPRTADAAVATLVDVVFNDADDVVATNANAQSIIVAADVDDGEAGLSAGQANETSVTLQTSAGFWATNGLTSITIGCAIDFVDIATTAFVDDGVAQNIGISEGTANAEAEVEGATAVAEESSDAGDEEGCLGVADTLVIPGGFSGTITVTAVTTEGVVDSDVLTVQAAAAIASVSIGAADPLTVDAAGTVGADLAVTVRDSTGAVVTNAPITITTTLGVIDQLANACVTQDGGAGDNALTAASDAACTMTTSGSVAQEIEVFGNGVAGTATVTATAANGVQGSRTYIITGGTVASLAVAFYSDNDATPVMKSSIQNVDSTTTGLDELIIGVSTLDSNGNSIIPVGDVTIKITGPDGAAVSTLNLVSLTGAIEASGLTITNTSCSSSVDDVTGTCIDTVENVATTTRSEALAAIDIDTTTALPTGTYTVTATHGTGTALKTGTGTFAVAAVTETIAVAAADATIEVGGSTTITATVTDASGNPVAEGTTVTFSSSSAVTVLQTTAATGSSVTANTNASGVATVTALGLSQGTTQIFGTTGGKVGSTSVTVGAADTTAPVVTAPADITVEVASGSTGAPASNAAIVAFLAGATATDNVDGSVSPTNDAPTEFPVGATTVTFSAADAAGNTGTATAVVTVTEAAAPDTTAPVVTAPAGITVEVAAGALGAPKTQADIAALLAGATATDDVDASVTVSNNAPAIFPVGATTVTFSATDAAGNTGTAAAVVTVTEAAAPAPTPSEGEGTFDRTVPNVGVNTAVWNGGTVDQLSAATAAAGGISVTVFIGGEATVLIPGAPAFVNAAFNAAF
ncbi:MAG: HYR domain-containing protein, partial [Dehalococcoidia bacterium]